MSKDFDAKLPKEKIDSNLQKITDFTYLIHGGPGIGKSSLASQFENSFFMFFDPGGGSIVARKKFIPDWNDALRVVKQLEKNPGYCDLVIIDTGYKAYEKCFYWAMDELGLDDPGDKDWGNSWKFIDRYFQEFHERLSNAGYRYLITAHSEIVTFKKRNGVEVSKIKTMLGKQAWRYYNGIVDMIAYFELDDENNRVLQIRNHLDAEVKCRLKKKFLYSDTQKPIDTIPMGGSEEEGFKNFEAAFYNKLSSKGVIQTKEGKKKKKKKLKFV